MTGFIRSQAFTTCDQTGSPASKFVDIYSCLTSEFSVSPNPTTDNVTIAVAQPKDGNEKKAMIYQIKVADQFGIVKKQYKYSAGTRNANISLKGFISGIYTIQAYNGTSWSSVQVIKQ